MKGRRTDQGTRKGKEEKQKEIIKNEFRKQPNSCLLCELCQQKIACLRLFPFRDFTSEEHYTRKKVSDVEDRDQRRPQCNKTQPRSGNRIARLRSQRFNLFIHQKREIT